MDTTESAKIIARYFGAWNSGDLSVFDEIIAPDYINHSSAIPNVPPGPVGIKPIVTAIRTAFPDILFTIEDMVIGEGKVAIRVTWTGTHKGDFFGIAPTGKQVKVDVMQIEHIKNGQIVEHWRRTDDLGLRQQLGLINPD